MSWSFWWPTSQGLAAEWGIIQVTLLFDFVLPSSRMTFNRRLAKLSSGKRVVTPWICSQPMAVLTDKNNQILRSMWSLQRTLPLWASRGLYPFCCEVTAPPLMPVHVGKYNYFWKVWFLHFWLRKCCHHGIVSFYVTLAPLIGALALGLDIFKSSFLKVFAPQLAAAQRESKNWSLSLVQVGTGFYCVMQKGCHLLT